MASKEPDQGDAQGSKASSFELQFQEFSSYIQHFEACFKDSQSLLKTLKEAFKDDAGSKISNAFMTNEEEQKLEANLAKKSTILVVGQTNSGKSSLVNELLGGTYLPTAEVPCTSRIVRLKYSEHNYVQLLDKKGNKLGEAKPFKKKGVPKTEIALEDTKRDSTDWVQQVVEVGVNNSLLQNGHLEFVDAPGMSENDNLDNIVQECLDGVLQVIIYVIDGNSSLRTQERTFLYELQQKIGRIPIFYVCNKVDRDEEAENFDRDSDDEDEDLETAVSKTIQEKTHLSYSSLVRYGLLNADVKLDECDVYHGVSTREVRKARRERKSNQYTDEFEKMKRKLLKFAATRISSHLKSAAGLLSQIQQRVFDFFLSRDFKQNDPENVQRILYDLKSNEMKYVDKVRKYIRDSEANLARVLFREIQDKKEVILMGAESMQFAPIQIGDVIGRNEVVQQCRDQIQTLVLMQVVNISLRKGRSTVLTVTQQVRRSLEKTFDEVSKQGDRVSELVKNQLLKCILLNFHALHDHFPRFDYSLMKFKYKYTDQAYKMFKDLTSVLTGTTINKAWKRSIAEDVLDNINRDEIAKRILQGILLDLDESHEAFLLNVQCIQQLCDGASKQSTKQHSVVVANSPSFAKQMCKTEALLQSLFSSRMQVGKKIEEGHRGVVYECSGHGMNADLVAKQLNPKGGSQDSQYLAVQYVMRRAQEDRDSILKPLCLRLDQQNQITILLPKMETDLYHVLKNDRMKDVNMQSRLAIVLQMADACAFSRHCGLSHVDSRITNILLDNHFVAKLNVCKTRDDQVPYPDKMAPFHVPTKSPADQESAESFLSHDVYSLAVLLWLLLPGKYCRPEYALTDNVEEVYSAVERGEKPDVSRLADIKHSDRFQGLLETGWSRWRTGKANLDAFQRDLGLLRSEFDA